MPQTRIPSVLIWTAALVPLTAVLALAVASHGRGMLFGRKGAVQSCYARVEFGSIAIHFQRTDAGETPQWLAATWPEDWAWSNGQTSVWQSKFGFGYGVGGSAGGNAVHKLTLPIWTLVVVAVLPLVALLALQQPSRR